LVGLTSVAALAYVGTKVAAKNAPSLTSVRKRDDDGMVRPGDRVILLGSNFVPSGAKQLSDLARIRVKFGAREVVAVPPDPESNSAGDRIFAQVPFDAAVGACDVKVITATGAESNGYALPIVADTPVIAGAAPVPIVPGEPLVITGSFFKRSGSDGAGEATVWFGDIPVLATDTMEGQLSVVPPPSLPAGTTTAVKVWAHGAIAPSAAVVLPVKAT
jgi:hypothetical protein